MKAHLYCCDNKELNGLLDFDNSVVFYDPPFDIWSDIKIYKGKTTVCFTNWQNREYITNQLGPPRIEIIWHFKNGRWVSDKMPRLTHENILIYGNTGLADVGPINNNKIRRSTGKSSIGRWQSETNRRYEPKENMQINSVLEFPRNIAGPSGCWGKPIILMETLLAFIGNKLVIDLFMGSGSLGVAASNYGYTYTGCEIDSTVFDVAYNEINNAESQIRLFK